MKGGAQELICRHRLGWHTGTQKQTQRRCGATKHKHLHDSQELPAADRSDNLLSGVRQSKALNVGIQTQSCTGVRCQDDR